MNLTLSILLADDDSDDCNFFSEALEELRANVNLFTVRDGVELMNLLTNENEKLPDVIYLDLNMPKKSGIECLEEIKKSDKLMHLPVIIFSTSYDKKISLDLYGQGAHFYIRKPAEFCKFKELINQSLELLTSNGYKQPHRDLFVLNAV